MQYNLADMGKLEVWMTKNLREKITLSKHVILLGYISLSILANYVIIVSKLEILKSKWTKKNIDLSDIINTMKYLTIEEYVAITSYGTKQHW